MALSGTIRHPKNMALASRLGVDPGVSLGLLEALWDFTREYARDGGIGRFKDAAIVAGMMIPLLTTQLKLTPALLVNALVEEGWLDRRDDCRLFVHDWADWCDETTRKKLERAQVPAFADGSPIRRLKREEGEGAPSGGHPARRIASVGSRPAAERRRNGEKPPPEREGDGSRSAAGWPPDGEKEGRKAGSAAALARPEPEPEPVPAPEAAPGGGSPQPEVTPGEEGTGRFDRSKLDVEMQRLAGRGLPPATESDPEVEARRRRILSQARGVDDGRP